MKKTNKLISILIAVAMLLSMAPISAFAASVVASGKFGASGSNLTWSLDSDGVLTISGSGAMEDFANVSKVPWYSKRTNVKTVVIESGVTNIGKDAFYGISSLVNATISDTVTSIGNRAFSGSGLTNFEFSDAGNLKTIGNSAFNSTQIKNMVIPDGVTTLGSYVFGYGPIKSVTIPASVTSIGNYFFEETSSLNEVIFLGNKEPETIGDTVFLACSSLAYVSVPADYEGDTFSNMKVSKAAASVAEVNGQGFATLADAISSAQSINGAELKLLSHISIDSGITIESGNFTIDLNGKELFSNGYFLLRVDGADVTIVDSAGGGIFNATNDQGNIVLEVLSGSANISGGTFNSAGYPATVRDGTLKLTGKDFVLNGNWRIGWYGGSIDLSACTADEVRIQACADGLQASAVALPDGWGLFETDGTPCTEFVKNDIYVAKAGFKVTASVNPAEGGTVEGAGTYSAGATVNLSATAANGYRFINWIENGEEVSTSAVYTFTASKNRELTANFEIVPHTHSFTYTAGGSRIVATCVAGDCPLENGIGGMLTISAPADLYVDGETAKEAVIDNQLVEAVDYTVTYSAPYGLPPKDAGTYIASVTVGGATATVEFTLLNYAAKVTDKDGNAVGTYKTFADAITAASASEGSTVTLLDDVTLTEEQDISSGKFTLDLNGKTLLNETAAAICIESDADVTIKDSGEGGTIESKADTWNTVYNYGTLTVESGIIKGEGGISNSRSGTLNFKSGKIEADTYYAIGNYGTAYIYNGSFKSVSSGAIENRSDSTVYVYGGEFSGSAGIVNHSTAYIEGGEFTGNSYAALNLHGGTVEVTGGSFTGTDFESGYYSGTPYGEYTVYCNEGATLILKGGEFPNGFVVNNTTANTFLAEGYAFYDKDGNKISVADDAKIIDGYVQVKEHFVASVTDKDGNEIGTYKTFAEAVTAASASEGSTLTLLDDITLTETARISSGKFILDLNGKTVLNKTDNVLMIYHYANITIKDSREGGTVETGGDYCYGISNLGELTVESGTIKGNGSGISNHGTLTVNGGNFESYTYGAITNKATAKIYGGVFEGIDRGEGIQNDANGEIYIYGGKISGDTALLNTGTAYISGGEFISSDYAALNILKGTVEVTGGSFTGTDFSDGYFSGTPYGEWTIDIDEGATLILKGGEFPNGFVIDETTANTFLAEDYYYKDADGKLIDVADDATIINGYVKVSKGADLADAVITLDETQFTYSGMEHKPTVIVTVGGKTLTEGKDYTLTFANNVNAGTATVTIKAIGQAAGGIAGGGENIGNSSNSGDITESVYTGEVTKEFTINKKPVTVTATAPDKVYDGTNDIDYDTIVITFDGIVEGDTVGYTIKKAWFNGIVVGTDWPVPIVYNVTGEDANNYTFPAGGEYIAPDYFVEATADITAKDISDGFIILGAPLTYNGKEQTQTVEKVIPTGTAPEATYTVSGNKATNVGVYLLTVTGTGNFTGEAKIAYEIALDDECISHLDRVEDNGVMKWNVKSTDRESLEYVIDQLNNAVTDIADEDKKNEWADTKEACEDMLRIINSIELAIADVEEDYAGFSEDTVKSSDIPALDEIVSKVNEIKDRYGFNLTDEEAKKLEDILDGIEKLKAKIAETAEEIERIDEAVNGYDKETVTSDDVPELGKLIEDIKALTDGDNITEDEKAALEANDETIDDLVEKLTEVAEEIKKVDEAVKSYDEDSVKSTDSEDLAQLKEDIKALIDSDNTTENEKTALEEMIKDIEGLEDKITETEEKLEEIKGIENNYNPENVSSDDKAAIEDKIAEIKAVNPDNLTDEQREEYEEIKSGFEALLDEIAAAEKAVADIGTKLEMFDEKRVTIFWEDDIEALKAKIDELLADENMGEAEKTKLEEYKAECDNLIEIINTPKAYFSMRLFYFVWDALHWLSSHFVFIFNWIF